MRNYGYIRMSRDIKNWRWYKNPNTYRLFVHLLLMANYVAGEFETHEIKRGQYVTSLNHLCDELGLSLQQLRTAIKHLKSTKDISVESTKKYSIFTVNNYEKYAASTHSVAENNAAKSTEQYMGRNNSRKNSLYQNNSGHNSTFSIEDFEAKSLFKD